MKRILSVVCALLCCCTLYLTASAAGTASLSAGCNATTKTGEFTVELALNNNPGMIALLIKAKYDDKLLALKKVENRTVFKNIYVQSQTLQVNPYTVAWVEPLVKKDITNSGALVCFTFQVRDGVKAQKTTINFTVDDKNTFNFTNTLVPVSGCAYTAVIDQSGNAATDLPTLVTSGGSNTVKNPLTEQDDGDTNMAMDDEDDALVDNSAVVSGSSSVSATASDNAVSVPPASGGTKSIKVRVIWLIAAAFCLVLAGCVIALRHTLKKRIGTADTQNSTLPDAASDAAAPADKAEADKPEQTDSDKSDR